MHSKKSPNNVLSGNCHCKNIEVAFEISKAPEDLWIRKCPCSFCTKQGNLNVTDPDGLLSVTIHNKTNIFWYEMGHKTSKRLFCNICGVYIGAFMEHAEGNVCVLNSNVLEDRDGLSVPTDIHVIQQTPEERVAGRLIRWMPFELTYT
tara:strand:+ start:20127 stop:20570 length:444 start_codon:yes stop_codon:yes gene_type:complete